MDQIRNLLKAASQKYNKSLPHQDSCRDLVLACHSKLSSESTFRNFGLFSGRPLVTYNIFQLGTVLSRPIRPDIYIADYQTFINMYDAFEESLGNKPLLWQDENITRANSIVYTSVMSVACCYDLWQRGSRKTPGTFFEILMAGLLQKMLPRAQFSKHIPLASLLNDNETLEGVETVKNVDQDNEEGASVSTDLVIRMPSRPGGIVIPLKITTRERIVQPFAHQRILDSAFGQGQYQSLLVCISETQLDDKTQSVKQVCVPGTVKLFQKYLAPLQGLYYCDLPQRYAAADMQKILPVRLVGHLFKDVYDLLQAPTANDS
jgi:hypothetical protein